MIGIYGNMLYTSCDLCDRTHNETSGHRWLVLRISLIGHDDRSKPIGLHSDEWVV